MAKVLITYASDYGSTKKMAEVIADGVNSVDGATAVLKSAQEASAEDMTSSDAIIFGSPVHMGSVDWRIKKMIDEVCSGLWMKDALKGKVGAVFVSGGGFGITGGGAELTMLSMLTNIAELGMIMIPLPKGTPGYAGGGLQWGPCARTMTDEAKPVGLSDEATKVARHHGIHVARMAILVKDATIFDK